MLLMYLRKALSSCYVLQELSDELAERLLAESKEIERTPLIPKEMTQTSLASNPTHLILDKVAASVGDTSRRTDTTAPGQVSYGHSFAAAETDKLSFVPEPSLQRSHAGSVGARLRSAASERPSVTRTDLSLPTTSPSSTSEKPRVTPAQFRSVKLSSEAIQNMLKDISLEDQKKLLQGKNVNISQLKLERGILEKLSHYQTAEVSF